jgi:hypothetical protein
MSIEELAKTMRERALLIEGDESLNATLTVDKTKVALAKKAKLAQLEKWKRLYFDAGRWAGGARDNRAREAFIKMNEHEK